MYVSMPPSNPRKRPAPGSSPAVQTQNMQQGYNAPTQTDYLRWGQSAENTGFDSAAAYNMNNYGGNAAMSQAQFDQSIGAPSTQLARRPINRQLVPTAQRMTQDTSDDWSGQFGDNSIHDPHGVNGMMEENDNIELLEERAAVAKRDATSKRKQIPPFVQKLSR